MSENEKARTSGEVSRPAELVLPIVNEKVEIKELAKPTLHPAFYVMCDHRLHTG
jgi:hypothetical protein